MSPSDLQGQWVGELFVKASHVIISARSTAQPQVGSNTLPKVGKTWFNLEVPEMHSAARELEPWRRNTTSPLVLEVYLQAWGSDQSNSEGATGNPYSGETMLEQWTLQFTPRRQATVGAAAAVKPLSMRQDTPAAMYKRMVIALRSLYSYVRVLPAYRLHRCCKRDSRAGFGIRCRIAPAASPDVRSGSTGRLQTFNFAPLETADGTFSMGVQHQPASAVKILERTTAPVAAPQIISDYIGSPGVPRSRAPPPRRSTLSASLYLGGSGSTDKGAPVAGSPQAAGPSLLRRHSWSMQGRAASSRLPSGCADGLLPATPPSPQYSPSPSQAGTSQCNLRTLSTPPRYPTMLSAPQQRSGSLAGALACVSTSPPRLRSLGSATSRLSPVEAGVSAQPPLPVASSPRQVAAGSRDWQLHGALPATPDSAAAPRRASPPVRIPSGNGGHRMRSSADLFALETRDISSPRAVPSAPASAPAGGDLALGYVRSQRQPPREASGDTPFAMQHPLAQPPEGASNPAMPATPPMAHGEAPAYGVGCEGSSCGTSYPLAGSPQLPFAVTPSSSHSLASLANADHQPWGHGGLAQPSPPLSGRGGGALSAVRRQPSWSGRSSAAGTPAHPTTVGYSVSPVGHGSLASSVRSASHETPRSGCSDNIGGAGPNPPSGVLQLPSTYAGDAFGSGGGLGAFSPAAAVERLGLPEKTPANLLPFAKPHPARDGGLLAGSSADSEEEELQEEDSTDLLPFALDEASPCQGGGLLTGSPADSEEALGAFVRMIEHAPPLHSLRAGGASVSKTLSGSAQNPGSYGHQEAALSSSRMTLAAGLDQLARLRSLSTAVATS